MSFEWVTALKVINYVNKNNDERGLIYEISVCYIYGCDKWLKALMLGD